MTEKQKKPCSLSMKVGASRRSSGCICYRTDHGDYCVGPEAEYFAGEKGGIMIGNIYDIRQKEEKIQVAGEEKRAGRASGTFSKGNPEISGNPGYRKEYPVPLYHIAGA